MNTQVPTTEKLSGGPVLRFQIELLAEQLGEIEEMMRQTRIRTKREFFEETLAVYLHICEKTKLGYVLCFRDESSGTPHYSELVSSKLRNLRSVVRNKLAGNTGPDKVTKPDNKGVI